MVALVFLYIKFRSLLLKERNVLRKKKIGLSWDLNFFTRQAKKKQKKTMFEFRLCFFSSMETWWPQSCSTLNYKGQLNGHQILFYFVLFTDLVAIRFLFFLLGNLVATRSFNTKLQRMTQWPPNFQTKRKKKPIFVWRPGGH